MALRQGPLALWPSGALMVLRGPWDLGRVLDAEGRGCVAGHNFQWQPISLVNLSSRMTFLRQDCRTIYDLPCINVSMIHRLALYLYHGFPLLCSVLRLGRPFLGFSQLSSESISRLRSNASKRDPRPRVLQICRGCISPTSQRFLPRL